MKKPTPSRVQLWPREEEAPPVPPESPEKSAREQLWPAIGFWRHAGAVVAISLAITMAYLNSFNAGLTTEDRSLIAGDARLRDATAENARRLVREGVNAPGARTGWSQVVPAWSLLWNGAVLGNGPEPAGYHAVNFCLHWAISLLLYLAVLVVTKNIWPAAFAAAIFGVHPAGTEAVTSLGGRGELFGALFFLAGFCFYARSSIARGWHRAGWLLGLAACNALAFASHPVAWCLLPVILAYDLTLRFDWRAGPFPLRRLEARLRHFFRRGYVVLLPVLAAAGVFSWVEPARHRWVPDAFARNPLLATNWLCARLTAVKVIGKYFWRLVWPYGLSPDYSFHEIPLVSWQLGSWENWKALIALATVATILVLALRQYHRTKALLFFTLFFFLALLPASNLLALGPSIMAERNLYLPLAGFAGWLAVGVYLACREIMPRFVGVDWWRQKWPAGAARILLGVLVVVCALRTFLRNGDWKNDEALWRDAAAKVPGSYRTHHEFSVALIRADAGKYLDKIVFESELAAAIVGQRDWPEAQPPAEVLTQLGAAYRMKGDALSGSDGLSSDKSATWYSKSAATLEQAVAADEARNESHRAFEARAGHPSNEIADVRDPVLYQNLGLAYARTARPAEALIAFKKEILLAPGATDAYLGIANVDLATNKPSDAAVALLQAIVLDDKLVTAMKPLFEIYQKIEPGGCALTTSGDSMKLNAECALVRSHLASAYFGLIENFLAAGQRSTAERIKAAGLQTYHFAPEYFDKLLPPDRFP